jgi:dihydrofolate reductase
MHRILHLVAAITPAGVLGRAGGLPWHYPEDLARLDALTAGAVCMLGRRTHEAWRSVERHGRRPIVLSGSDLPLRAPAPRAADFPQALALADQLPEETFVCGGSGPYAAALALAGRRHLRLHLTLVAAEYPGDVLFPPWNHLPWRLLETPGAVTPGLTFLTLDLPANPAAEQ